MVPGVHAVSHSLRLTCFHYTPLTEMPIRPAVSSNLCTRHCWHHIVLRTTMKETTWQTLVVY